jgi:hypothetical protein
MMESNEIVVKRELRIEKRRRRKETEDKKNTP